MTSPSSPVSFFTRVLTLRHKLTKRQVTVFGAAAFLAVGPGVWLVGGANGTRTEADQRPAEEISLRADDHANVLTVTAVPCAMAGPDVLYQSYTGVVTARRTTELSAQRMGRVEHVAVDIGDAVTEGQVLVAMDQRHLLAEQQMLQSELEAAIAKLEEFKTGPRAQEIEAAEAKVVELEASVKLAKANFRRATELHRQSAVSTQERDENAFREESALAQLRSAREALELLREGTRAEQLRQQESRVGALQAQLDQTAIAIDDASIEAPFSGHVQARHIDEGTIVSAGESILQIIESGEKEVHVGLPTELVRRTSPEQFVLRGPKGLIEAEVIRVSPSIDQRTRSQEIVFRVVDPSNQVTVGASVEVDCPLDSIVGESSVQEGYWVPTDSLSAGARGLWALLVAAPLQTGTTTDRLAATGAATHRIERRQVELLSSQGKWSRIRGPIDRDELVVVDGTHVIVNGQQVRVQLPASTAPRE